MFSEIINPVNTKELFAAVKKLKGKRFRFAAGCTDLIPELRKKPVKDLSVINLARLKDEAFTGIRKTTRELQIGAGVTAHRLVMNELVKKNFPVLGEAAINLASTQIRHVATVGGNICTASPSGDMTCALVALDATCVIMNSTGKKRAVPIREFFTGPRETVLGKGEILFSISIPFNRKNCTGSFSRFIKVGTRRSMECSVVSLAIHIQMDGKGIVIDSGIAIGASAPTIRFTRTACEFLAGKEIRRITAKDAEEFAERVVACASPITDIRATAWYRKKVLFNISRAMFDEIKA